MTPKILNRFPKCTLEKVPNTRIYFQLIPKCVKVIESTNSTLKSYNVPNIYVKHILNMHFVSFLEMYVKARCKMLDARCKMGCQYSELKMLSE